jgi:UPF0716 protein FxsA
MPALLVLVLVGVPLLELVLLIQVGQRIGAGWTILLVVASGVLGALMLRREGRRAWSRFQEALAAGRWPGDEVAQGALVLFGGALLLTPGFLTDVVGLLLLFAPSRAAVSALLRGRLMAQAGGAAWRRAKRAGSGGPEDTGLGIEVVEVRRDDPDELPGGSGGGDGPTDPDDESGAGR